jgi:hypothetical protein
MTTAVVDEVGAEFFQRYNQAWANHDTDAIVALHTPDTAFTVAAFGIQAHGRDELRDALTGSFALWPDIRFEEVRLYSTPGLVVFESQAVGTLTAPLKLGDVTLEPNGKQERFACVDVIALEGGLIKRKDAYLDALGYAQRLRG